METHRSPVTCGHLSGRVALVTGAGAGLGEAIATTLAGAGASVAILDRDRAQARCVAAEIEGSGGTAIAVLADVSRADQVEAAVARTVAVFGGLHILVNNAAVTGGGSLLDMTEEKWDRCLAVNTRGTFLCCRFAAAHLPPGTGVIVNISSVAGIVALRGAGIAYSASKGAVVALTRALATELGAAGIRVNTICPGTVLTEMSVAFARAAGDGDVRVGATRLGQQYPLCRLGQPHEIAQAVHFLVSDDAATTSGQVLPVDGGVSLRPGPATPSGPQVRAVSSHA